MNVQKVLMSCKKSVKSNYSLLFYYLGVPEAFHVQAKIIVIF